MALATISSVGMKPEAREHDKRGGELGVLSDLTPEQISMPSRSLRRLHAAAVAALVFRDDHDDNDVDEDATA